jgi:hypothetical protein
MRVSGVSNCSSPAAALALAAVPDVPESAPFALVDLQCVSRLPRSLREVVPVHLRIGTGLVPDLRPSLVVEAFPRKVRGGQQQGYDGQYGR